MKVEKKAQPIIVDGTVSYWKLVQIVTSKPYDIGEVHVMFIDIHAPDAKAVITTLKGNGWKETCDTFEKQIIQKSRCSQCGKSYTGKLEGCKVCGSKDMKWTQITANKVIMQKIGALEAYQQETAANKNYTEIFKYLQSIKNKQLAKDRLMDRMEYLV